MYLRRFQIEGIKCFSNVCFEFPRREDGDRHAGWHVLLGANASGKTTALQAMAVCLIGPPAWTGLVAPVRWVRAGAPMKYGTLHATVTKGEQDIADRYQKGPFEPVVHVTPDEVVTIHGQEYDAPQFVLASPNRKGQEKQQLLKSVYASKKRGWLACGYGPFRRLSGGSGEVLSALRHPRQVRFASLFHESVALTQCEPWLRDLHHQTTDPDNPERESALRTLNAVKSIINSLLPGSVKLQHVTSAGVRFTTTGDRTVLLSELSDGYRSFLALAIDVLRHVTDAFGERLTDLIEELPEDPARVRVTVEGVVLIDEIDAHLHPSWQRRIGFMLQAAFPNIQFIVSSHSPFIAQAASEDGLFVLRSAGAHDAVSVVQPIASVRGWRADTILTSELFGLKDTVDPETEATLAEYHQLSTRRSFGKLDPQEQDRLDALETRLSHILTAPGETLEERKRREQMDAYVDETLEAVEGEKASAALE
jgi:hypothetical protein